jgi:hypothetical protein
MKTIEIHGSENLGISKDLWVPCQKLNFKTCNIISYKTGDGTYYHSDAKPPILTAIGTNVETKPQMLQSARRSQGQDPAQEVEVIPGDSITPATPTTGEESTEKHGKVYDVEKGMGQPMGEQAWDEPLGNIDVFFFVFKSYEEAMATIKGLNAPAWD